MKITYKTDQVRLTIEIDDSRYANGKLTYEENEAVKLFEKIFLQGYISGLAEMLQGVLYLGEAMPTAFDFLSDQAAQQSHTLLSYLRDLKGG